MSTILTKRIPNLAAILIIALSCGLVHSKTVTNGFVYDDHTTISGTPFIRSLAHLPVILGPEYFNRSGEDSFRPLATLTYFAYFRLFGTAPFGYHAGSVAMHALAMVLLYIFIRRFVGSDIAALPGTLVCAVHPASAEAVFCVSYNEDILVAILMLSALLVYQHHYRYGFIAAGVLFALALFAKEMAITLPAMIVLYETIVSDAGAADRSIPSVKQRLPYLVSLLLATIGYCMVRFFLFANPHESIHPPTVSLAERFFYIPHTIISFAQHALIPRAMSADYVHVYPTGILAPSNITALVLLAAMFALLWYYIRRFPPIAFGICWFIIALGPVLNIVPIGNPMAGRYLYVPVLGLGIVAAGSIAVLVSLKPPWRYRAAIAGLLIVGVWIATASTATMAASRNWKDDVSLWTSVTAANPNNARARYNLGNAWTDTGNIDAAIDEFSQAIAINPHNADYYNNRGLAYARKNDFERAITDYRRALDVNPQASTAHNNLGTLYAERGLSREAAESFNRAIAANPNDTLPYVNLASLANRAGQADAALGYLANALRLDAHDSTAHRMSGLIHYQRGDYRRALLHYHACIAIDPLDALALANTGIVLQKTGNDEQALSHYDRAIAADPSYADAFYFRGALYAKRRMIREAFRDWERALAINPGHQRARQAIERLGGAVPGR